MTGRYSQCHTMRFCSCKKSLLPHFRHFRTFIGILTIIRSIANITLILYLCRCHSTYVIFIISRKNSTGKLFMSIFSSNVYGIRYSPVKNYLFCSIKLFIGSKFWKINTKSHRTDRSYFYISIKKMHRYILFEIGF